MTSTWFFILCGVAVIGCGLVSGLFLTFSDFVMRSLRLAEPSAGIEVMQIINREIFRSVIMVFLWGMLVLTVALGGYAWFNVPGPASSLLAGGGAFYVVGVLLVTFLFNVPMNNRLDTMDHRSSAAAAYWGDTYVPYWTFWNYVRAISSLGSAICFLVACVWLAQQSITA